MRKKKIRFNLGVFFSPVPFHSYFFYPQSLYVYTHRPRVKFTQDGSDCFYSTYLGGTGHDYSRGISLDNSNNVYISGTTFSTDFPNKNPYQPSLAGDGDVFVSRFSYPASLPKILLSRTRLYFGVVENKWSTGSQTFFIWNDAGGVLNWTISNNVSWLKCSPAAGTGDGEVTVSVYASSLSPGNYTGDITVSDSNAVNSPQRIQVILNVYTSTGPGASTPPFGYFETPNDKACVYSSIPDTGWALDDVGVEHVKIYRQEGKNLVYIGKAIFVEGARPDVELAYPNYPNCYQAGWKQGTVRRSVEVLP